VSKGCLDASRKAVDEVVVAFNITLSSLSELKKTTTKRISQLKLMHDFASLPISMNLRPLSSRQDWRNPCAIFRRRRTLSPVGLISPISSHGSGHSQFPKYFTKSSARPRLGTATTIWNLKLYLNGAQTNHDQVPDYQATVLLYNSPTYSLAPSSR